jgi:hypothetical protein
LTDKEILEQRLSLFTNDAWLSFSKELEELAQSLENIQTIDDEKTLFLRKGQVDMLNMIINLEATTKLALDQLD